MSVLLVWSPQVHGEGFHRYGFLVACQIALAHYCCLPAEASSCCVQNVGQLSMSKGDYLRFGKCLLQDVACGINEIAIRRAFGKSIRF